MSHLHNLGCVGGFFVISLYKNIFKKYLKNYIQNKINMIIYNQVKGIMSHNFDDYYEEEYDPRFNYTKFNKAVDRVHDGDFLIEETNDFSEMCAIVRVLG